MNEVVKIAKYLVVFIGFGSLIHDSLNLKLGLTIKSTVLCYEYKIQNNLMRTFTYRFPLLNKKSNLTGTVIIISYMNLLVCITRFTSMPLKVDNFLIQSIILPRQGHGLSKPLNLNECEL
jgi:hypothetical protein